MNYWPQINVRPNRHGLKQKPHSFLKHFNCRALDTVLRLRANSEGEVLISERERDWSLWESREVLISECERLATLVGLREMPTHCHLKIRASLQYP